MIKNIQHYIINDMLSYFQEIIHIYVDKHMNMQI